MDCLHLIFIFAIVFMVVKGYCPSHIAMLTIAGLAILFVKNRVIEGFYPCPSTSPNCSPSPIPSPSPSPSNPSNLSSPSPSPNTDILSLLKKYKVYVGIGGGVFLLLLILLMSGGGSQMPVIVMK